MPPLLRRRDLWVVVAVVVLAVVIALLVPHTTGATATVRMNGKVTHSLPLKTNTSLTLKNKGITLTLTVENGKAQITHSDCPDGICKATAPVFQAGQAIICLPAACSVTIEGAAPYDGVTY
ncbi:MAG: NusG domain II-containing protein [Clostridia bacterium]|nr:NusG domain II-containing protein [Clostridia bacterium]